MIDTLRQWAPMFEDQAQNRYDLPPEVLKLKAAVHRLDQEVAKHNAARPDAALARSEALAAVKAAARTKAALPHTSAVDDAERATTEHHTRATILQQARADLAGDLGSMLADSAEQIITDYLRPVFDRLAAQFAKAASLLPEPANTDALMRASDDVRTAWLDLDTAATTYQRIRDTADRLNRPTPVQRDTHGEFAMMRNVREVWADWQVGRTPPWTNTDPRLTFLWLARHGAQLWLPTSAERDALWWEHHGAVVQRAAHNRQQLAAFGAAMGG